MEKKKNFLVRLSQLRFCKPIGNNNCHLSLSAWGVSELCGLLPIITRENDQCGPFIGVTMVDALNGGSGRIVPIVLPRQHSTQSNPDEMSSGPEQFESNVDEHNSVEQEQTEQQSTKVVAAGRKTRSGAETTECLEIPCLNELGLYALPTEGDGILIFCFR